MFQEVSFMLSRHTISARFSFGAILGLAMLTAGCGSSSTAPSGSIVTVQIAGDRGNQSYSPSPVTVKVGQIVNWQNTDSITHTATADTGSFNVPISPVSALGAPVSIPVAMNMAGTFNYHCTIHPDMVGQIIVQ